MVRLPDVLEEVSGLAWASSGDLLAHDDERAVVYRLDPESGEVIGRFWPGGFPLRGDFEGIATRDGRVYLADSDGTLVVFDEEGEGERRPHAVVRTGLGTACEIEGLAYDSEHDALLLPCKTARSIDEEGQVVIFAYGLTPDEALPHGPERISEHLRIDRDAIDDLGLEEDLRVSAIDVHPVTGHLFLLAGPESILIEVDRSGTPVSGVDFRSRDHRQPEGLAIGRDGTLFIADEGGDRRARLTRYPPGSPGG